MRDHSQVSLELPPEADPARDFIEALAARYESQIEKFKQKQAQSLSKQVQSLTERFQKPIPRNANIDGRILFEVLEVLVEKLLNTRGQSLGMYACFALEYSGTVPGYESVFCYGFAC